MSVPLVSFLAASLVPAWENHKLKKHHSAPVLEESPAESPEQEELEDLEDSTEE